MRYASILVLLTGYLTGCAGMNLPDLPQTSPQPSTLWTEANARYSTKQHEATLYAQRCDRDRAMFMSGCFATVDQLNRLDKMAEGVQDSGYRALGRQDTKGLFEAIGDLDAIGNEMDSTLRKATTP